MLALGLWLGGDYGISIDEPGHIRYAQQMASVYAGQTPIDQYQVDLDLNGPFFSLVAYLGGNWVATLRPGWGLNDGIHFMEYLSLVFATLFLWLLLRRYVGRTPSWILAAAFFTQPILFGHAFINPKDTPFLAFTLGGVTLGILALPNLDAVKPDAESEGVRLGITGSRLWLLVTVTLVCLSLSAALLLWGGWLPMARKALESTYNGTGPAPVSAAFQLLARGASTASLDDYQARLATWFDVLRLGAVAAMLVAILLAWAASIRGLGAEGGIRGRGLALAAASGIAIGLATAIRSVAPLVILPLAVLYVLELRRSALTAGIVLLVAAIAACVAAWPYLWQSPVRHFLDSLAVLSHFPWTGDILFNGRLLDQGQQPWFYIPELIGLQITLPILGLAALGLVALAWPKLSLRRRVEIAIVCGALSLPVLASLRPGTIVYNNFRQFLFCLPALFLLAGIGLEAVLSRFRGRLPGAVLAVLILLPGVAGLVRLHPYEYIYYNALAGTGPSVYTRFESDYWCTSYREAMQWVDANAPSNAIIAVGSAGFTEQVTPFARSDLRVVRLGSEAGSTRASLAIVCDGLGGRLDLLPNSPVLMTVGRAGADLAQVKDLGQSR